MRDNQEADQESGDSSSIAGTDNDRDEAPGVWIVDFSPSALICVICGGEVWDPFS
jgi:hypothetical protein